MRPRILFGDHPDLRPVIERLIDHERFEVGFADFAGADFQGADLVVPLTIRQIGQARAANANSRRRAALPDADIVELCDDKLAFNRHLIARGFESLIPELLADPPGFYPYVRKGRHGESGDEVRVVRSPDDDRDPPPHSFCQRAVEGTYEYVLHLLRVDGRIRYAQCYRYFMGETLVVRGRQRPAQSISVGEPAAVLRPCAGILDALGFEGTCCFNYKYDAGALRILELNPRFGGSLAGDINRYVAAHLTALA